MLPQLGCVVSGVSASHHGRGDRAGAQREIFYRNCPPGGQYLFPAGWVPPRFSRSSDLSVVSARLLPPTREVQEVLSQLGCFSASHHGSSPAQLGTPEFPLVLSQLGCVVSVSASTEAPRTPEVQQHGIASGCVVVHGSSPEVQQHGVASARLFSASTAAPPPGWAPPSFH